MLTRKDKAFGSILDRVLIETQAEHLLNVLRSGTVSTNAFLRMSLRKRHFRLFFGPLLFVHFLNLLFHNANGLV
jgi:hypothetical protein